MKKLYILLSAGLLSASVLSAQSSMTVDANPNPKPANLPVATAVAPWDVLFNTDLSTTAGAGNAGVAIINNEYWVTRWAADSIFTFDMTFNQTGAFTIAGVTGVRSLTSDGTSLYAGANTGQILKINPVTKTLTSTISTPGVPLVRYVTYDPTANAGAGGFWAGTWDTDFTQVSMTGTTLATSPAANHGLTATYGLTWDGTTPGGPFLWAFHQTDATIGAADIIQVEIATGFTSGVVHDVTSDFGAVGDLAGGIFHSATPTPRLVGILQGTPSNFLFAYDALFVGINENKADPSFVSAYPNPVTDVVNIGVKRTNNDKMNMQIMNANGKVVFESSMVGANNYVNMSKYPAGVYTVQVTHNGKAYTSKLIRK